MQKAWFALAVAITLAGVWMARYDIEGVTGNATVMKLDRFTGNVAYCSVVC